MGLTDMLGQVLGGNADASQLQDAATKMPTGELANGLAAAFRSDQTPPIGQMVGQLFGNSNGTQKAGLLNQLLAALGPAVAGGLGGGVLSRLLPSGATTVTPEQAQQVSPDEVQKVVENAHQVQPGVADELGSFYAQHSGLIKTLGGAALALALAHVKNNQQS